METCSLFIAFVIFYTAQLSEGRKRFSVLALHGVMPALIILSAKKKKSKNVPECLREKSPVTDTAVSASFTWA